MYGSVTHLRNISNMLKKNERSLNVVCCTGLTQTNQTTKQHQTRMGNGGGGNPGAHGRLGREDRSGGIPGVSRMQKGSVCCTGVRVEGKGVGGMVGDLEHNGVAE